MIRYYLLLAWRMMKRQKVYTLINISGLAIGICACMVIYPKPGIAVSIAYRTTMSLWIFITAMIFALLIAVITVSYQSIKAALANPVKNLRIE